MRPKIKLLKLLTLSFIGLYLVIRLSNMLIEWTDYCPLNHCVLERFMLRIIICCTALTYYLHLQEKKGIEHPIQPSTNGYRLTIGTILTQLMMTFALMVLSSIQEALGYPSVQPVLHFSSRIDFLYRGIVEITCLAAILEELLFRGILEKLLSNITPIRSWITMISALTFSLMHYNMINNLLYFVMGCFLSYLYRQANHIIYPIIAHGLHNLCATSIMYLPLDKTLDLAVNSLTIGTRIILAIGSLLATYGYVTYMLTGKNTKAYHLN
ncbi:CPBP family intramembrane glutamic endopeptidase [Cardinium endosymbiont of Oedothorax gibbosus]|uniref:CPBP family intramembrane glutamic endopeptidase n=1 Tax=Cardinium endosymbiont of Oedothorax gibbosus TaxID=931101 RepID=UPI0020245223|nr:CPBP family intramembrane glutamic endopeptidase [Cardinium endosymbiont of Oedothorax gibbosus]CAH2559999.1 Type II CAAX prenyl endopeptidase Rce1-like family protein [Cardinium endosymbiont of Oedothorax gibbosus]